MSTVTCPEASTRGTITPLAVSTRISGLRREARVAHEAREAARAVAALLDLAAVGVPDAVAEIVAFLPGLLHHQQLVAADAEMAVGDAPYLLGREAHGLAHAVEHDEVVALALHLGEAQRIPGGHQ
jgi:hypothetical protein